ncbi:hypothetical protein DNK10_17780 [Pseudomonas daroniae]|nr:hypothetical protein DNK10_17780 [Pseudomonas daroniae]
MSDLVTLVCQGTVSVLADGAPTCSGLWMLVQMPEPFNVETLDFSALGKAFAVGFTVCAVPAAAGIAARALLDAIRGK